MDSHNFYTIYVFKVKESTADIPAELPCFTELEIPSQLPVWGYWWLCLVDFWNFFSIYVFEVRESFDDIPTELPCLGDLKNSSS